jgi:transposase InsO family protein
MSDQPFYAPNHKPAPRQRQAAELSPRTFCAFAREFSSRHRTLLIGTVWASPSTWYRLVRKYGWRRPRLRIHPAKPKIGLRTTRADEMWHIDTTVIRLLDGTRAYLHAVIDNFSRRILAWRVADTFAPVNSVAVLVDASRGATPSGTTPVVLADGGVENVNAQVDDLINTACCGGSWPSRS